MSLFFYIRKNFMQFFILVLSLVFLTNVCLADLNDLINYEDKHGNLTNNHAGVE